MFKTNDRVEHVNSTSGIKGTVRSDDGKYVVIDWDDEKVGIMEYNHNVCFNAFNLVKLASTKQLHKWEKNPIVDCDWCPVCKIIYKAERKDKACPGGDD